jgi:hypothetical protein
MAILGVEPSATVGRLQGSNMTRHRAGGSQGFCKYYIKTKLEPVESSGPPWKALTLSSHKLPAFSSRFYIRVSTRFAPRIGVPIAYTLAVVQPIKLRTNEIPFSESNERPTLLKGCSGLVYWFSRTLTRNRKCVYGWPWHYL